MKYKILGPSRIKGDIKISGAKNFSIKALAAALLNKGSTSYTNLPNNLDAHKTLSMLEALGVTIEIGAKKNSSSTYTLNTKSITNTLTNTQHANMMVFLIGAALIHRFDHVIIPQNKGCSLGMRLDDFHVMAFNLFGIECKKIDTEHHTTYELRKQKDIAGAHIALPYPSVGATETALFLAIYAKGVSIIENAAIEPEVLALIVALTDMGAQIHFESDRKIIIHGIEPIETDMSIYVHGDLLEAASWACLAAICDGEITAHGVTPELIGSFLGIFNMLGGKSERIDATTMRFTKNKHFNPKNVVLETGVFPALRTDLQPMLAALAAKNGSVTMIHETVYNKRIDYIESFEKFGIHAAGFKNCFGQKCRFCDKYMHSAMISKAKDLQAPNGTLHAGTIRNGMAQILLASAAQGETIIEEIEIIERGYCSLLEKLQSVGVKIEKIE